MIAMAKKNVCSVETFKTRKTWIIQSIIRALCSGFISWISKMLAFNTILAFSSSDPFLEMDALRDDE